MTILVVTVDLGPSVDGWFTGRDPATTESGVPATVGQPGNLAHRRPHLPAMLAADRARVARSIGHPADRWHLMRQVHGRQVAVVDGSWRRGAELPDVDGAVTDLADRPLVVQTADCVPVLLAGRRSVGVAHAGRLGVHLGVVDAVVSALTDLGEEPHHLRAAIGPAIGGCCYEVPADLRDEIGAGQPAAIATTTWGTPSLDLPGAVEAQLGRSGVAVVSRMQTCTRCDPEARWFSHRGDQRAGRQVGIVVRRSLSDRGDREVAR